ncbi:MAG: type IV pilus inner membrane component PilO [Acidiferrobacterales bacterium]
MNLDDLKNIDLNNIGSWPYPVKIGAIALVCVLILFLGYWFVISDEIQQLNQAQKQEQSLKQTFLEKKSLALNLPAYKQQMREMKQVFGTLLRQLPNKTEVPNLLVDITQAGLGRGLQFVLFKPEQEKPLDFYAELPVAIKVTGTYHELGEFVSDLAALPRIVTLSQINIASEPGTDHLTMTTLAKTYRYLEPDEMSRPAAKRPPFRPGVAK